MKLLLLLGEYHIDVGRAENKQPPNFFNNHRNV